MGMVTYDGLNGASAQSCKTDRLTVWKVPCMSRQSIAGQIVAGTCIMYLHMRSSSGLFHVHINAKFPAGKRKFTPPSFGKECQRQCREEAVPLPLIPQVKDA